MIPQVENEIDAIHAACRRHGVARLEIFGSAARATAFDPQRSDVDFIVSFAAGTDLGPWLREYFQLRDDLARIVGRPVDLVMDTALRHPLFQREAQGTRQVIYAA